MVFDGVMSSGKDSMAVKLLSDILWRMFVGDASSPSSSLFLFLPFLAGGSLRAALSSLHIARDSPKVSVVLEDDALRSSRVRSTAGCSLRTDRPIRQEEVGVSIKGFLIVSLLAVELES